jgi:sugar phosphate permease
MKMRYRVLAGLLLLALITYLDRVAISVASVRMQDELHLNPAAWGIVLGAFSISYALFEVPTGTMGDRLGGRRVLTRIVLWWSLFTALTGTVRSIWFISAFGILVAIRFLFGAGEAGAFPNISAVVSRWFPAQERARAVGLTWTASRIGGALSPLLIVPLQRNFGWRAAFFVLGLIGVAWAVGWYAFYRDHPSQMKNIRLKEIEEIGETPSVSRHHRLPWKKVLRNPNFLFILLMYFSYCCGSYFFISWMPTYLQKGRAFSEARMAVWATFPFILSGTANFFGGWLSDRLVPKIGLCQARRVGGQAVSPWVAFSLPPWRLARMILWLPCSWRSVTDVWTPCCRCPGRFASTSDRIIRAP